MTAGEGGGSGGGGARFITDYNFRSRRSNGKDIVTNFLNKAFGWRAAPRPSSCRCRPPIVSARGAGSVVDAGSSDPDGFPTCSERAYPVQRLESKSRFCCDYQLCLCGRYVAQVEAQTDRSRYLCA